MHVCKQLEIGMIQPVSNTDHGLIRQVHYLLHRVVTKCDKQTTKVRVVNDAFVKTSEPSFYECLYTGPNFN